LTPDQSTAWAIDELDNRRSGGLGSDRTAADWTVAADWVAPDQPAIIGKPCALALLVFLGKSLLIPPEIT